MCHRISRVGGGLVEPAWGRLYLFIFPFGSCRYWEPRRDSELAQWLSGCNIGSSWRANRPKAAVVQLDIVMVVQVIRR